MTAATELRGFHKAVYDAIDRELACTASGFLGIYVALLEAGIINAGQDKKRKLAEIKTVVKDLVNMELFDTDYSDGYHQYLIYRKKE